MKFSPNYSEIVQEIEPGFYRGALLSIEAYQSKKGTSCVKSMYEIVDGKHKGRVLPLYSPITGKGADSFRKLVRCFEANYFYGEFDFTPYVGTIITLEVLDSKGLNGERNYLKVVPVHSIQSQAEVSQSKQVTLQ